MANLADQCLLITCISIKNNEAFFPVKQFTYRYCRRLDIKMSREFLKSSVTIFIQSGNLAIKSSIDCVIQVVWKWLLHTNRKTPETDSRVVVTMQGVQRLPKRLLSLEYVTVVTIFVVDVCEHPCTVSFI